MGKSKQHGIKAVQCHTHKAHCRSGVVANTELWEDRVCCVPRKSSTVLGQSRPSHASVVLRSLDSPARGAGGEWQTTATWGTEMGNESKGSVNISLHPEVLKELEYMIELHQQYGAPAEMESLESLINYVLASIADGSRRPGAWERQILEMLGLVVDCAEHRRYRDRYGP